MQVRGRRAINGNYGELLSASGDYDCAVERDLHGFWLDDLDVYSAGKRGTRVMHAHNRRTDHTRVCLCR
jgi:hypothetical protein